ncbi:GNAT family protein [Actinoplanes sp. NPDC024001]|uniref:GNAT family N-acetyltransferase n=1 Tax=Actinoplanes sp. NPDC024001 TaxID=3154598 RepID=UPI0033EFE507
MSRLVDVWPLYGLTIRTARLELRLPRDEELAGFADVAAGGVHPPGEQPFLSPWTDGDRAQFVLQEHWRGLSGWTPEKWQLGLGVFHDGEPIGVVALLARDFRVVRQVTTWSWLGLAHHGRGYGTEARVGLLTLAFDHLGAETARTDVFRDNHASQGVSRKLGYEPDGIAVDARGDEALISDRLRLSRERWNAQDRPPVTIEGVTPCLPKFGL